MQINTYESKVVQLVNDIRRQNRLQPLAINGALTQAARRHSQDMAMRGYLDHYSPEGRSCQERARAAGYPSQFVGENIAYGSPTPEQVVQKWMDSPGHRNNILNGNYRDIGVGFYHHPTSRYKYTWTQVFGSR
ncbi:CAP domain-containing protein [Aetokthonos hydrillicola Thurmond2011]|uniref:CAP domain-containing protein n=1 Tax=Aetokthonos hydrillicola Thurmond2011 TaxID=2712845 RepID=A0AAP5IDH4_9CYAN|nr:CAP domain-containing protein [Aetokthonos hydrillicola]MBO3459704.1 CAP domain-containing protein [Aetokthonos hydrillicola CCALA 1050]MBW4588554.1 CAP domain-containing protein [Aetokthonos hydrillicola CCALA 1050]MDR9899476.1 CAP domain-containing protein [Aetokthonos hydrillicola Thurmond2011]